jgi:glycosyltransferase involved in cell wall biosynthesis
LSAEGAVIHRAKVLLVDHTTQPGGAELGLPRIARETDHDLRLVFLEPLSDNLPFDAGTDIVAPPEKLRPLAQLKYLRRVLRKNADRIVVSNTLRAAFLVALLKPRAQVHVQELHDGVSEDSLSRSKRLITSFVFSRVDGVMPNSRWTASTVPPRYQHLLTQPIYSPSGTTGTEGEARSSLQGQTVRLLSLSRVVEWKGIHVILDALAQLDHELTPKSVKLTIAGGTIMGPSTYIDDLRRAAGDLPFEVSFVPHQKDVRPLLLSHDVLVHASIRPEPYGQVIVQGLAYGLCVVASRDGGPGELVVDGVSGLLHNAGDPTSLSRSLRRAIVDPALRSALSSAGRVRAREFSDARCTALFDEALVGPQQGTARATLLA